MAKGNLKIYGAIVDASGGGGGTTYTAGTGISLNETTFSLDETTDLSINGLTVGRGNNNIDTNTVVGISALASNDSGYNIVANGFETLHDNTSGVGNIANGFKALRSNTTGSHNIGIGSEALFYNNGSFNIAAGYLALNSNTTGRDNIAIGSSSLRYHNLGRGNVGIGRSALENCYTGEYNVAIGHDSGSDEFIDIQVDSNLVVLGNNSTTTLYCKAGSITATSDIRDKNITGTVGHGLEFVKQLNPIKFFFKKSREEPENHGPERFGFSAQEVLELEGDNPIIINNKNPESLKMASNDLIPVLVNAIKEQQTIIVSQQTQVDALTARLDAAGL